MRIGAVTLRVADLDRATTFYRDVIGLQPSDRPGPDRLNLTAPGGDRALIKLIGNSAAPRRPPGTSGLFHLALLVPSRRDLAAALDRVVGSGWRLVGASDHLVSEAIYLSDPEGNGIEVYRDRAREEWRTTPTGEIEMATLPLDLESLMREVGDAGEPSPLPVTSDIGHVHLNVSALDSSESFYAGAVGFDVTVRSYPGALFLGAGGYHHHIGCNVWAGRRAPPPYPGSLGLVSFEIIADGQSLQELADRIARGGWRCERTGEGRLETEDPSGNRLAIVA